MKVQLLKSASVVVEAKGVKILADPWLVDGEYYGSWAHYPPYEFDPAMFADVDFIYLSHIHPDHFSRKTLALLPRSIPVLVHAYATTFLRANVEALGFRAVELPHGCRTHLKNGVHINIFAADNCDPAACGRFFGCARVEKSFGSTQIDSLSVIDDGNHVVVNVNDCPFELAKNSMAAIKEQYPHIDVLLTGYSGAGPYPQCFPRLSSAERDQAAAEKKSQFLEQGQNFVVAAEPRFYVPFAGTYTLAGKLARLNSCRGVPEVEEAREFFERADGPIDRDRSQCVVLGCGGSVDLSSGECDCAPTAADTLARARYVADVLAPRLFDYELDGPPHIDQLLALFAKAYGRMDRKRRNLGLSTQTKVLVSLGDGTCARLSLDGRGFDVVAEDKALRADPFVLFRTDPRLLMWLLKGPAYAHWDNAEIGSHIEFERQPNCFERGIYHLMCFFHA
ncbi:MAG TPA: MBL fold metallo-hydrolase [Pirellulales bacterium]|nr:MBL fold metallo-hydrolase [Pirellulales bacterium]